ncbi:TPA: hypothetical protein DEP96_02180 [Candidatus Uhrbacteria bacterium]|nr:hypothetical protein [Candidatus Uhrbacteria bacterium]
MDEELKKALEALSWAVATAHQSNGDEFFASAKEDIKAAITAAYTAGHAAGVRSILEELNGRGIVNF